MARHSLGSRSRVSRAARDMTINFKACDGQWCAQCHVLICVNCQLQCISVETLTRLSFV